MTDRNGKKLAFEILLNDAELRAHRAALQAEPRAPRHRHERAHRRHRAVPDAATDEFDFDMMIDGFGPVAVAGQRAARLLGLARPPTRRAAATSIGIKDPAIDELVELVIAAPDRESLIAARRALDRVLLWSHFVVPATGTAARPASPTGTASRGPAKSRAVRAGRLRHLVDRPAKAKVDRRA